jgi:hypothetical protein
MKHVFSVLSVASVAFFTLFLSTTNVSCKKGDTGPKGDTGVANAVYSAWATVNFAAQVVQPGDTVYTATIDAPAITKDVLDKGTIHVYVNLNTAAAPDIFPLPYFDGGAIINPDFEIGKINLISNVPATAPYRYIIITGSVPAGRLATNVDWKSYPSVQAFYGLKD